jgi:hypothetical protein
MTEKARAYLNKELRTCFKNKQHAINRNAPEAEIRAISEKISVIQYLLRCADAVETMKEERMNDNA